MQHFSRLFPLLARIFRRANLDTATLRRKGAERTEKSLPLYGKQERMRKQRCCTEDGGLLRSGPLGDSGGIDVIGRPLGKYVFSTVKTWTCFCPSNLLDLKGQRDPGEESFRKRGEIVVKQKLIWVGYLEIEYPRWLSGQESACRRHRSLWLDPWVGKIPWRRAWQPTPGGLATVHRVE